MMSELSTIALLLGGLVLVLSGCSDQIVTPNTPAQITAAGPAKPSIFDLTSPALIEIPYTISDEEGDDQDIVVEICLADDTECGYPVQGIGSDGTSYVPTTIGGQAVERRFVWDIGCGRLSASARIATTLDQEYIAKVSVQGSQDIIKTEPYTLTALGLSALPLCTRR